MSDVTPNRIQSLLSEILTGALRSILIFILAGALVVLLVAVYFDVTFGVAAVILIGLGVLGIVVGGTLSNWM